MLNRGGSLVIAYSVLNGHAVGGETGQGRLVAVERYITFIYTVQVMSQCLCECWSFVCTVGGDWCGFNC